MPATFESTVREFFTAFDKKDYARVGKLMTDDAQGVDELSRKWMRGRKEIEGYFAKFGPMLSGIRTEIKDTKESTAGDTSILTMWIEQDYKLEGKAEHFSGPVTVVGKKKGAGWVLSLVHAVPLPKQ